MPISGTKARSITPEEAKELWDKWDEDFLLSLGTDQGFKPEQYQAFRDNRGLFISQAGPVSDIMSQHLMHVYMTAEDYKFLVDMIIHDKTVVDKIVDGIVVSKDVIGGLADTDPAGFRIRLKFKTACEMFADCAAGLTLWAQESSNLDRLQLGSTLYTADWINMGRQLMEGNASFDADGTEYS